MKDKKRVMPDSHASLSVQLKGARCITTGSLKYHTLPGIQEPSPTTSKQCYAYCRAGNFRGRKLLQNSRFCGYSRKFSPRNIGGMVSFSTAWASNLQKFSPSKFSNSSCKSAQVIGVILSKPYTSVVHDRWSDRLSESVCRCHVAKLVCV